MKKPIFKNHAPSSLIAAAVAACILLSGCASNPSDKPIVIDPKEPPLPTGVLLRQDKDIQGVWVAEGFNFRGYDGLLIEDTLFKALERPNEEQMRAWAKTELQHDLLESISATGLFQKVAGRPEELPATGKNLKMANTIIEYEKGGGGARYFAGVYGAGQPVIKVRGEIMDGDKLVCVYEARRSGESGGARMFGGFMSDENVQKNDIKDLALDLADLMKRRAGK